MKYIKREIKEGINLHTIKTDKFKTNLVAIFLTTKLKFPIATLLQIILSKHGGELN